MLAAAAAITPSAAVDDDDDDEEEADKDDVEEHSGGAPADDFARPEDIDLDDAGRDSPTRRRDGRPPRAVVEVDVVAGKALISSESGSM